MIITVCIAELLIITSYTLPYCMRLTEIKRSTLDRSNFSGWNR